MVCYGGVFSCFYMSDMRHGWCLTLNKASLKRKWHLVGSGMSEDGRCSRGKSSWVQRGSVDVSQGYTSYTVSMRGYTWQMNVKHWRGFCTSFWTSCFDQWCDVFLRKYNLFGNNHLLSDTQHGSTLYTRVHKQDKLNTSCFCFKWSFKIFIPRLMLDGHDSDSVCYFLFVDCDPRSLSSW